jgi:hypothetical protein
MELRLCANGLESLSSSTLSDRRATWACGRTYGVEADKSGKALEAAMARFGEVETVKCVVGSER